MSMTVSEALSRLASLVVDHGRGLDDATAWDVILSHIEREVDEAMVERALAAQWEYEQKHASPEGTVYANGSMQAALIAALEADK